MPIMPFTPTKPIHTIPFTPKNTILKPVSKTNDFQSAQFFPVLKHTKREYEP